AIAPDADVIGVALGVPFRSLLGHRGLSHSLAFAAALAAVVVAAGFRHSDLSRPRLWLYFFLAAASHGVLYALSNVGPGTACLAPFDNDRYFFPWRPIVVSPIGIRPFFSAWGLRVLESEFVWIWIPCLVFAGLILVARRHFGE